MKKHQKQQTNINCIKRICKNSQEKLSKYVEEYSGITLISLVITIIILIILAGISINLILGENGLFNKAREATQKFSEAQKEEEKALAELEMEIKDNENLPEITKETPAGTQVKLPNEWIPTDETEKISVRAIATGEGDKVPVPKGFYYVGGTVESGVVISDDPKDKDKYANYTQTKEVKEGIPTGVAYNNDGTVNVEQSELKGNQFVWIPVKIEDYTKVTWTKEDGTKYSNVEWDQQPLDSELTQIKKYGGFYIGRYEAGTSNIKLSTKVDFAKANTANNMQNEEFSIRKELNHTATGNITCKAGEIPYYHADYFTALELCNRMYQTAYVQSGLVTGTMWDAMITFIANGNNNIVTTESYWGNYNKEDSEHIQYVTGQGRYSAVKRDSGSNDAFIVADGQYHYGIRTTASTEGVKQKNLYDVAGNLWEWTNEKVENKSEISYMVRGGSFYTTYFGSPACYRGYNTATCTYERFGFRPALYII